MASRKTWLWIILGGLGFCVLVLFVIAGAGVYFVAQHFETEPATGPDALRSFDEARARFRDAKPLIEIDERDRPHMTRDLASMPDGATRPQHLWILAWDPDEERTVKVSLPFWLLRMGRQKVDLGRDMGVDFERFNIDMRDLERVGPLLVFDQRAPSGERVLIWTQ